MRFARHRGAATRDVDSDGILLNGIRALQAVPARQQPSEHSKPVLHLARAPVTREHGGEAEADQDSDLPQCLTCGIDLGWPDDRARKKAKSA